MTRGLYDKLSRPGMAVCALLMLLSFSQTAAAAPFGSGSFGNDTPFGNTTSLGITLGGDVDLSLTPDGGNLSGAGSTSVTVTTTAAEGYGLYMYANGSTAMTSGSASIPVSSNGTEAPLAVNTWGYNTDGSATNFLGLSTLPTQIKSGDVPFPSGDVTTVTFGVLADTTKEAGNYSVDVTYTAVALN
jgi:hypothetical protein